MTGIVNQVAALGTEAGGLENILFQYIEHILPYPSPGARF